MENTRLETTRRFEVAGMDRKLSLGVQVNPSYVKEFRRYIPPLVRALRTGMHSLASSLAKRAHVDRSLAWGLFVVSLFKGPFLVFLGIP